MLSVLKIKELRTKIFYTIAMIFLFRFGSHVPLPFVDSKVLMNGPKNDLVAIFNTFSGGALKQFSIFALGIMPYITASIVIQLLQMDIVPKLTEWSKQGEVGQKKTKRLTKILAIVLAFVQANIMSYSFDKLYGGTLIPNSAWYVYFIIAVMMTIGTAMILALSEVIDKKGIGDGVSIIILVGIISVLPDSIFKTYESEIKFSENLSISMLTVGAILLVALILTMAVVFIQNGQRKIEVHYARVNTTRKLSKNKTYLPLKVNSAGVMPVIFAITLMQLPQLLTYFVKPDNLILQKILRLTSISGLVGSIIYVALIIAFSFFYAEAQVNPEKMADNLKSQGGYVPTVRPGIQTQEYIEGVLNRLTFAGSIFLSFIAIFPTIIGNFTKLPPSIHIGGTSLIIIVSVILNSWKKMKAKALDGKYRRLTK